MISSRYHPIIVFGIAALAGLLFGALLDGSVCVIHRIFGVPSPACGMTRAHIALLHLDVAGAFRYHPLVPMPLLICVLVWFGKLGERICLVFAVLLVLVWIARMFLMFPNQEPMVFYEGAVIPVMFDKLVGLVGG